MKNLICYALQEKVTYVGKMNFEFSTKLGSVHPYQYVPEKYKAYCSIEPEKRAYRARILADFKKCTFEKIAFKVFGGYKDETNSYHSTAYTDLAEIWL